MPVSSQMILPAYAVVIRVACVNDQLQFPWSSVISFVSRGFINTQRVRELQFPNQHLMVAIVLYVALFQCMKGIQELLQLIAIRPRNRPPNRIKGECSRCWRRSLTRCRSALW